MEEGLHASDDVLKPCTHSENSEQKRNCLDRARGESIFSRCIISLHLIIPCTNCSLCGNKLDLTLFLCSPGVFERALGYFRTSAPELKEERAMLLEEWLNMESSSGDLGDVDLVRGKLPKKLKKRRNLETENGPAGYALNLFFGDFTF